MQKKCWFSVYAPEVSFNTLLTSAIGRYLPVAGLVTDIPLSVP